MRERTWHETEGSDLGSAVCQLGVTGSAPHLSAPVSPPAKCEASFTFIKELCESGIHTGALDEWKMLVYIRVSSEL